MVHTAYSTSCAFHAHSTLPRFEIHAESDPQTLARIVGTFAAQSLMPSDLYARQSCAGMWIGLHIHIPADHAEQMAEKLRALAFVYGVVLIPAPLAAVPSRPCDLQTSDPVPL